VSTVPGRHEGRVRQKIDAGRDANVAGGDQFIFNVGPAGAPEPAVPGLLPRDVPGFTGRLEELDRLAGGAARGSVVVTAIGGTAGVGKTALAVHAAHRLLPQFPDGHLYADLRGYTTGQVPTESGEVLEVFLRRLGVAPEEMPASADERSGLLRQLLATRRVLMVLDNASSEAQVRPLLPGAGGSLVLITSRSVLSGLEVDERIGLDVLPAAEATALLAAVIGPERAAAEPGAVAQIAGWCGCLPLALRIAGQLLAAHPAWPVAKLAGMLAGEQDRLGQLAAGDLQVRTAFEVSYRQLPDEDARMFRLLGLHPGSDFDVAAAASLAGIDAAAAGLVLDRLADAYLVTDDGLGRFGLHDLLRLFARRTCQDTDDDTYRRAAKARLVGYYADMAWSLATLLDPQLRPVAEQQAAEAGESLPSLRQVLAMFEEERPILLATIGLAAENGWNEQVGQLSEGMGGVLTLLRYLDDLLSVKKAALAAARNAGDTAAESRALGNLGNAYQELQRYGDAIDCYQQALEIFPKTGDRHNQAMALNNLGHAYEELQRYDDAIDCCQQALAIFRETGDRHGEGLPLGNLGNVYLRQQRYGDAIDCYQQALATFRETRDRHGEAPILDNLGLAYAQLQRLDDAIAHHQQAVAVFRETGDRHGEGQALANLGSAYQDLRQPEKAATCWQSAAQAMLDSGDDERAAELEQRAALARFFPAPRRRWLRHRR
jgi:tetratricopeptide (TPR) repeat protein